MNSKPQSRRTIVHHFAEHGDQALADRHLHAALELSRGDLKRASMHIETMLASDVVVGPAGLVRQLDRMLDLLPATPGEHQRLRSASQHGCLCSALRGSPASSPSPRVAALRRDVEQGGLQLSAIARHSAEQVDLPAAAVAGEVLNWTCKILHWT